MYFSFQSTFLGKLLAKPIDELVNSLISNNLCKVLSSIFMIEKEGVIDFLDNIVEGSDIDKCMYQCCCI